MLFNKIIFRGLKLPALSSPAAAPDVLAGKQIVDGKGEALTGAMPNRGAVSQALNAGGSYTIPAGYHNGAGAVTANSLASQTAGTATAADIASGKTAWVNGVKLEGKGAMSPLLQQYPASSFTGLSGSFQVDKNGREPVAIFIELTLNSSYNTWLDATTCTLIASRVSGSYWNVTAAVLDFQRTSTTAGTLNTAIPFDSPTDNGDRLTFTQSYTGDGTINFSGATVRGLYLF